MSENYKSGIRRVRPPPPLVPPRARYVQHDGGISVAEQSIVSETYDHIRAGIVRLLKVARLFHQAQLVRQPAAFVQRLNRVLSLSI
jgi:hypothetical protein